MRALLIALLALAGWTAVAPANAADGVEITELRRLGRVISWGKNCGFPREFNIQVRETVHRAAVGATALSFAGEPYAMALVFSGDEWESTPAACAALRAVIGDELRQLDAAGIVADRPPFPSMKDIESVRRSAESLSIIAACKPSKEDLASIRDAALLMVSADGVQPELLAGLYDGIFAKAAKAQRQFDAARCGEVRAAVLASHFAAVRIIRLRGLQWPPKAAP